MNETLGGLFSSRINLNLRESSTATPTARDRSSCSGARPGPFLVRVRCAHRRHARRRSPEIFKEIQPHASRRR